MMNFLKQKNNKIEKTNTELGFTLMETLVAIFILLISTTGPLAFAQSGLRASFLARDQIVAFYLAQDVIETIKNKRDNASFQNSGWLGLLGDCTPPSGGAYKFCNMTTSHTVNALQTESCSGNCDSLKYDRTPGVYEYKMTGADDSKYTRTIYTSLVNDHELQIIVKVSWETLHFAERSIVVQENIYDWIPRYTQP